VSWGSAGPLPDPQTWQQIPGYAAQPLGRPPEPVQVVPAPRKPRRGKRIGLSTVAFATVLAVVAYLFWPFGGSEPAPAPKMNVAPFYYAVAGLDDDSVIRYSGSSSEDGTSWDITVTSGGQETGTVTVDGEKIPALSVGGVTYVKPPESDLSLLSESSSIPVSDLDGRWLAGDTDVTDRLPQGLKTPAELASALRSELMKTNAYPVVGKSTTSVDGRKALSVTVPDGVLYVTTAAPYLALRFSPKRTSTSDSTSAAADIALASDGSENPGLSGLAQTDLGTDTQAEADQAYGSLIAQTKTLDNAPDVGVDTSYSQNGDLSCTDSSCTVTEDVTTSTTSNQPATLSGSVSAVMTATVTADGQAAGSCSATKTLPINGSGTIVCDDPEVAPVVAEIEEEKQEEADEEEQDIEYDIDFEADVSIETVADVQAEVTEEVNDEQAEQKAADAAAQEDTSCPVDSFADDVHTYFVDVAGAAVLIPIAAKNCSSTSGNNSAAVTGKKAHKQFSNYLDSYKQYGYGGETTISGPNGTTLRPDGVYLDPVLGKDVPVELKPGNAKQIAVGLKQLEGYENVMGVPRGSGQLWIYLIDSAGNFQYVRLQ